MLLLSELEEIVDMMSVDEFRDIRIAFFDRIARCASCKHFQVAERALYLWNNDQILGLMQEFSKDSIPIFVPALVRVSKGVFQCHSVNYTLC